ncbi:MAG TPA: PH domain-containing protein, partial [Patescibacteria group bacterium]|nr:PH domain-containing protein [Patescibacteria group bacterium]
PTKEETSFQKRRENLRALGMSRLATFKSETYELLKLVDASEYIGGVVYGHSDVGSVMMAATDRRVLYIDTKPLFTKTEDISYDAIDGITLEWAALAGTVILHTSIRNFRIRTVNRNAATTFTNYVERRLRRYESRRPIYTRQQKRRKGYD